MGALLALVGASLALWERAEPTPDSGANSSGSSASEWHCVCYEHHTAPDETRVETACRPTKDACSALAEKIRRRRGGYFFGEQPQYCTRVEGVHPRDGLGGLGSWKSSRKAGSWVFNGQCMLTASSASVEPTAWKQ